MSEKTAAMLVEVADLKAGMRCSIVVDDPLYEIEDVTTLDSSGKVRVTFEEVNGYRPIITLEPARKVEVHLTLDEAVAEFYRLDREEREAFGRAYELGEKRSDMSRLAQSLGWRG